MENKYEPIFVNKAVAQFPSYPYASKNIDWTTAQKAIKHFYLIDKEDEMNSFYRFPGLLVHNKELAIQYSLNILPLFDSMPSVPRGVVPSDNCYIVIGIRHNHKLPDAPIEQEPYWYTGESSEVLVSALKEANISPYYTNYFCSPDTNYTFLAHELEFIFDTAKNIKIIYLGKSDIFSNLKIPQGIKSFTIQHPSYIARTPLKYVDYINTLREIAKA